MIIGRPQTDVRNGIALRTYYESMRGTLSTERESWDTQYQDLARFFLPRAQRLNLSDTNRGERQDFSILNNTATLSLRTLRAGMLSGMSSPTRAWFNFRPGDDRLWKNQQVKDWCKVAEDSVRAAFLRSNFYQTLHVAYGEEGLYGTTAFLILEDEKDTIRCHPYPVGSYYITGDDTLRIDCCMRILNMTVRQIVERFGYTNVSQAMKELYNSNAGGLKETWYPIVHVIHKNDYLGNSLVPGDAAWSSVYYEQSNYDKVGILRKAGFDESPLIVGRWDVIGENFYGESPAMDCLGDNMGLQSFEGRVSLAVDKQVNPPMVADPALDPRKLSVLPGDVVFADTREGKPGFKPAYQVDFRLDNAVRLSEKMEKRIQRALYEDLFLMLANSDRREVTAEEIRAKQEEKLMVLGPVLERNNDEMLKPSCSRTLNICIRNGWCPPPPAIMVNGATGNAKIKVEFVSILAQAQRLMGLANVDRLMSFVGNEVAVDQGILDNIDLDKATKIYGDLLNVPPEIMRPDEDIAKIREDRQKQAQQQQAADNAQKLAAAAQNLSNTDMQGDSALKRLMPQPA